LSVTACSSPVDHTRQAVHPRQAVLGGRNHDAADRLFVRRARGGLAEALADPSSGA
jgi:hypothetical protein